MPELAAPLIDSPAGSFRGTVIDGVRSWRGIRYAEAPTGDRRWRDPVPAAVAEGVLDASGFGPACPQQLNPSVAMGPDPVFDEDCLTLNVWAPGTEAPGEDAPARPVMVWVHGGAYTFGASSQPLYDATSLTASGDVIIVTLNYRLGAFGFLDLSGVVDGVDGNLALKDVLTALRWVQTNIAAFGGDPARVTVFGESAGGGLVTTLLATPSASGLFCRAIAQSSPVSSVYGPARAKAVADRFVAELGIDAPDAAALRAVSVDEIVRAGMAVYAAVPDSDPGTLAFAPVIDGDLLPEAPVVALHEGRGLPVPLLIGTNKDEASLFKYMKSPLIPITDDRIAAMFTDIAKDNPSLELPSTEQVHSAYEHMRHAAVGLGIARDIGFRMPTVWAVEGHSQAAPTWLYRFDHSAPFLRLIGLGATHGTELPYLFGNLVAGPKDPTFRLGGMRVADRISQRMQARWTAFAHGNAPDVADAAAWPVYSDSVGAGSRATMVIDDTDTVVDDLDAPLRAAWGDGVIGFR